MKSIYIAVLLAIPSVASAQSAFDAFRLSQHELRGSARFMSMAGAFGALGGDISTMTQNPAGIGIYTRSEIGASVEFDFQNMSLTGVGKSNTSTNINNIGYVGSAYTGSSVMPYFTWGVSYNRLQSFDRKFIGGFNSIPASLTEYMASTANGLQFAGNGGILGTKDYDPFYAQMPYLPTLAVNTGLIVPGGYDAQGYQMYAPLFRDGSYGSASTWTRESGYTDEYSINFGGNFANVLYWGIGFGIRDVSFTSRTYYGEAINDGYIPAYDYLNSVYGMNQNTRGVIPGYNGYAESYPGYADWGLENYQTVHGSGFNMKVGLIFKPVNEFRLGLAVHTPTWYHLTYGSNAWVDYDIVGDDGVEEADMYSSSNMYGYENPYATAGYGEWNSRLNTPWRLLASAAGVIGGRFIISADYEYDAYKDITVHTPDDGTFGGIQQALETDKGIKSDVKTYFQATNTVRVGAEYRIDRHWSGRLGYSWQSSPTTAEARSGSQYIYGAGAQTISEMLNSTQHYTCGVGYRNGGFYLDLAYVHRRSTSEWQAFSAFPLQGSDDYTLAAQHLTAPRATLTDTRNQLVLSLGFKF
ncbi:MAG: hypothetical protein K2M97_01510 [Muribaculaceae bacterium]|nr:hypothetical protein [Muribaculaceae bacterium]